MSGALNHLKHNAVAYLALFVALGGTSYAAATLGPGSVGTRQLKNHSITPNKLQKSSIAGYVRDWAQIDGSGHLVASRPRAHIVHWTASGPLPGGIVSWGHPIPHGCFGLATTSTPGPGASSASVDINSAGKKNGPFVGAQIVLSKPETAVNVAVLCPQQ